MAGCTKGSVQRVKKFEEYTQLNSQDLKMLKATGVRIHPRTPTHKKKIHWTSTTFGSTFKAFVNWRPKTRKARKRAYMCSMWPLSFSWKSQYEVPPPIPSVRCWLSFSRGILASWGLTTLGHPVCEIPDKNRVLRGIPIQFASGQVGDMVAYLELPFFEHLLQVFLAMLYKSSMARKALSPRLCKQQTLPAHPFRM